MADSSENTEEQIKVQICYHCDKKSKAHMFCEIWETWTCRTCLEKHHRTHHTSCTLIIPKEQIKDAKPIIRRKFRVYVTRYDGVRMMMMCVIGEKIEMEDHWAGTYIFFTGGMVLVNESRAEINERILFGLRTTV